MTMIKRLQILLFSIFCSVLCVAQPLLRFNSPIEPTLNSLWDVTLTNSAQPTEVVLVARITEEKRGFVYHAQSRPFRLSQGLKRITPSIVQPIQTIENRLPEGDQLPPGIYTLHTQLIDNSIKAILAEQNKRVYSNPNDITSENKLNELVQFNGSAIITSQVAHRTGNVPEYLQGNFIRTELFPKLTVWELPVGANVLYTTEKGQLNQSLNQFNLHFDAQQYQQILKGKLLKQIQNNTLNDPSYKEKLTELEERLRKENFPNIDELRNGTDSLLDSQTEELKRLEGIQQVLGNPVFSDAKKELKELQAQIANTPDEMLSDSIKEKVNQLEAIQKEYEQLVATKDELNEYRTKVTRYRAQQQELEQIEQLKINGLLDNPDALQLASNYLGINDKASKLLSNIRNLSVGNIYPYHSDLSLNGTALLGGHFEYDSNWLYFSGVAGRSTCATKDTTNAFTHSFAQHLYAVKLGIGKIDKSHFHIGYLIANDVGQALQLGDSSIVVPSSNQVANAEIRLTGWDSRLLLDGEIAVSLFNRDRYAGPASDSLGSPLQFPLFEGARNRTSSEDYAYLLRGRADLTSSTRLSGFVQRNGAGYRSFGAPVLLQDQVRYAVHLDQSFWENHLVLTAFYRNNYDNLIDWKPYRTTMQSAGLTANLSIPKYPTLQVTWSPHVQNNNADSDDYFRNETQLFSVVSGYRYGKKKVRYFSQLSYLSQQQRSSTTRQSDNGLQLISWQQTTSLKGVSLNAIASWQQQTTLDNSLEQTTENQLSLDISGQSVLFKKWSNTLGAQWYQTVGANSDIRWYLQSRYPVADWLTASMRLSYGDYNRKTNFKETLIQLGLFINW